MATWLRIMPYSGRMLVNSQLDTHKRNAESAHGPSNANMIERFDQTAAYWARPSVSAEIASSHASFTLDASSSKRPFMACYRIEKLQVEE
jgi:hypothetical protein